MMGDFDALHLCFMNDTDLTAHETLSYDTFPIRLSCLWLFLGVFHPKPSGLCGYIKTRQPSATGTLEPEQEKIALTIFDGGVRRM